MLIFNEIPYIFIFLGLWIVLIIIDRVYWKCSKCHRYLPNKIWFTDVKCCPYCKNDIDNANDKK